MQPSFEQPLQGAASQGAAPIPDQAYAHLPDVEAKHGGFKGREVEIIKSSKWSLAPTTKKVLVALAVVAVVAVVFTGVGAAGIGAIGIAFAAIKASAVLSVALSAAAVSVCAISRKIIEKSQKAHTEGMLEQSRAQFDTDMKASYQELCSREDVCERAKGNSLNTLLESPDDATAQETLSKNAKELQEIQKRKELIFAERLNRSPEAQQTFKRLQMLFQKNFAIPIDQRMALLNVVKMKTDTFDGVKAVDTYLARATAVKSENAARLAGPPPYENQLTLFDFYTKTIRSKITVEDSDIGPLTDFNILMSAAMGDAVNTQFYTDGMIESVKGENSGEKVVDGTQKRSETNVKASQLLKPTSPAQEQALNGEGYVLYPKGGMWVQNSWAWADSDEGKGTSVTWTGKFAFNQTRGDFVKEERSATLDLQALGPLDPSQKVAIMKFVKTWCASDSATHNNYKEALLYAKSGLANKEFLSTCKQLLPTMSKQIVKVQANNGGLAVISQEDATTMVTAYQKLLQSAETFAHQMNRHMLSLYM